MLLVGKRRLSPKRAAFPGSHDELRTPPPMKIVQCAGRARGESLYHTIFKSEPRNEETNIRRRTGVWPVLGRACSPTTNLFKSEPRNEGIEMDSANLMRNSLGAPRKNRGNHGGIALTSPTGTNTPPSSCTKTPHPRLPRGGGCRWDGRVPVGREGAGVGREGAGVVEHSSKGVPSFEILSRTSKFLQQRKCAPPAPPAAGFSYQQ
jgi:hypothetical protein